MIDYPLNKIYIGILRDDLIVLYKRKRIILKGRGYYGLYEVCKFYLG